jgi:hypothetical protein
MGVAVVTTPELITAIVAGLVLAMGGTGGVAALIRRRNGKAQQAQVPQPAPSQPQIVNTYPNAPPPDFDPAGDTGQFAVALEQAPTDVLLQMATDIKTIASTRPATRADLDTVRGEINGKLDTHSNAIAGLRSVVAGLPCQAPLPAPCPAEDPPDAPR